MCRDLTVSVKKVVYAYILTGRERAQGPRRKNGDPKGNRFNTEKPGAESDYIRRLYGVLASDRPSLLCAEANVICKIVKGILVRVHVRPGPCARTHHAISCIEVDTRLPWPKPWRLVAAQVLDEAKG
jgi:hypothetical protein